MGKKRAFKYRYRSRSRKSRTVINFKRKNKENIRKQENNEKIYVPNKIFNFIIN